MYSASCLARCIRRASQIQSWWRREIVGLGAELRHPGLERVAGTGGLVEEQHEQRLVGRLVGKEPVRFAPAELLLQLGRKRQGLLDLLPDQSTVSMKSRPAGAFRSTRRLSHRLSLSPDMFPSMSSLSPTREEI